MALDAFFTRTSTSTISKPTCSSYTLFTSQDFSCLGFWGASENVVRRFTHPVHPTHHPLEQGGTPGWGVTQALYPFSQSPQAAVALIYFLEHTP